MAIMAKRTIGLSRDLIFHPGETLRELLDDREMKPDDLAVRTVFPSEYINGVLNGDVPISAKFAAALESVFGVEAEFWKNLQANYDAELLKYNRRAMVPKEKFSLFERMNSKVKHG